MRNGFAPPLISRRSAISSRMTATAMLSIGSQRRVKETARGARSAVRRAAASIIRSSRYRDAGLFQQLDEAVLVQRGDAELRRLVGLRSRILADHDVVGLLAHRADDFGAV